ncbi:Hypothetical_protein [Hexamita inflata]|uniref:Hypothetical_protein n=1 Tax=Hexamita inflata TaxID=28002 RepID=A0AA86VRC8_9EUKA|nr:Hypothetical protein HINF_LOCUS61983 [Hexamita inflata]
MENEPEPSKYSLARTLNQLQDNENKLIDMNKLLTNLNQQQAQLQQQSKDFQSNFSSLQNMKIASMQLLHQVDTELATDASALQLKQPNQNQIGQMIRNLEVQVLDLQNAVVCCQVMTQANVFDLAVDVSKQNASLIQKLGDAVK